MIEAYFKKYFHSIYQEEDHYNEQEHCITAVEYMCIKALKKTKKNFINKLFSYICKSAKYYCNK